MKKADLRTLYLERRRSLSSEGLADASRKIADVFFRSVDLRKTHTFHCFISIEKFREIDTFPILQRVWHEHPHIITTAPRVDFVNGELITVRLMPESRLSENKWGIREPAGQTIADADIDMILVPLLCFDERGNRIGYGRGFYDRLLRRCRKDCRKIGLSVFDPVKAIEDVAASDIALDLFITPDGPFGPL